MKKAMLGFTLVLSIGSSKAVLVTMPDQKELTKRLQAAGADHLIDNTNIIKQLARRQEEALAIAVCFDQIFLEYQKNLKNPSLSAAISLLKPRFLTALVQDSPEAIAELKEMKLIK